MGRKEKKEKEREKDRDRKDMGVIEDSREV